MYEGKVYLTTREAADYCNCTEDTIRRWHNDPKHPLRGTRTTREGPLIFKRKHIDNILEANMYPEAAKAKKELRIHEPE